MSLPIVVTHPSVLLHNGLRRLFAKSRFRPIKIATSLTQELQDYLGSLESGVWLTGVESCVATTDALVRKVVAANPRVKAVIMTASQEPEHIVAALEAGACGFLSQDIAADTLLRSLELIAHCEMIVHPRLTSNHLAFDVDDKATHLTVLPRSPLAAVRLRSTPTTRPAMSLVCLVVRC
jgi:DNA-binding NarL/FixJ family response regulator